MIPRQLDEIASQHAETMRSRAGRIPSRRLSSASRAQREREPVSSEFRNLRRRTGWTLVAIGLRIAAATGR